MSQAPGLKIALKRGALVTLANWPLVAVQFIAESTLQLILGVPVVGGIFLVVLLLDADVEQLLRGDVRDIVTSLVSALRANPAALAAFALALLLVLIGGSVLTFIVKGGTMAVFTDAEANAGAIERPPLRLQMLRRANRTGIEPFLDGCQRFGRRYVRLGLLLLLAYALTAAAYLGLLVGGLSIANNIGLILLSTIVLAVASSVAIVWISIVNLLYLLTQMVIAVEDISVRSAIGRVFVFLRKGLREVAGIFGVVLVLVILAMAASFLATAGFGLIGFVPIVAVAVMPLQVAAWLVRGLVFQYLALSALGAYLTQYRYHRGDSTLTAVPDKRLA
jgi:hypothetical protein